MFRAVTGTAAAIILLVGCGSDHSETHPAAAAPAPIKDLSAMLPPTDRTAARVVPDHMLGQVKMPGGTLGDYDSHGTKFQMFIIDTESNQQSAFLLLDMKGALHDRAYIPYMGGYFGVDGNTPVYVFSKLHYLAGVAGLPKDVADPLARVLASRLR